MAGWIKLHRSMLDWEWYGDPNTMRLFIHLLFKASYEDNQWRGVKVRRGQLITGRIKLSEELGISQQSIRTSLKRLESTNEITIKVTNKYSLLTVENYDNYQNLNDEPTNKTASNLTTNQPTTNHQSTTTKEVKKTKKVKKEPKSVLVLPDWINQELWDGFMEIREKQKAVNSDKAIKALINKLSKFREQGFDPNESISTSLENSWKGVFEPKQQATKKFNLTEALKNDMQRITEREMGNGPVCEVKGYLHG